MNKQTDFLGSNIYIIEKHTKKKKPTHTQQERITDNDPVERNS
jgi:hypothetical protein